VVVADTIFDYLSLKGTYETGNSIDPLWGLSDLLVGLGAVLISRVYRAGASRSASDVAAMSTWRGLVPYGLLPAVGFLVLATAHVRGDEAYKPGVYVGASVLVALVVARQVLAIAENRRLYCQLAAKSDALTLANTRLTALARERERQAATAQAFADLSASLTGVHETEPAYIAVLPQLSRMLGLTHAGVFERHKGSIILAATWQQAGSTLQLPRREVATTGDLVLHTGHTSWMLSNTPLASESQRDGLWVEPSLLQSGMCVQLSVHGEVCGWLSLQSASPHAYDAESLQLLTEVGARLELALGNVRLYAFEQQRARSAEALARLQEDFVASVSHELRTPLTAVLGYAEVLQGRWDQLSELQRKLKVQRIVVAANRQKRLIDDLLRVSSLEHEKLSVRCRAVEVLEVVARAMDVMNVSYATQAIDAAGPPDLVVLADDSFTEQVLVNLLDNAAKYSAEGSPIEVRWTQEDNLVAVRVHDHGPGIPEDGRGILFSRFGRVPGSRVRAGRVGTGLGLYLGREYAQAMGGTLDLESAGSSGSTFLLRLPIYLPDVGEPQAVVLDRAPRVVPLVR
jgi:signal transduction histidine kinase